MLMQVVEDCKGENVVHTFLCGPYVSAASYAISLEMPGNRVSSYQTSTLHPTSLLQCPCPLLWYKA
jgi:hypothetical protein